MEVPKSKKKPSRSCFTSKTQNWKNTYKENKFMMDTLFCFLCFGLGVLISTNADRLLKK